MQCSNTSFIQNFYLEILCDFLEMPFLTCSFWNSTLSFLKQFESKILQSMKLISLCQ